MELGACMLVEHSTKQAIPLALLNFIRKNKLGSTQSESKENSENGQHVGAEMSGVPISSAHCTLLDYLGCNPLAVKGKYKLTYNLDDLGQEHAISHILLEVLDEAFVARFGEVMIGPIGVDLQKKKAHRQLQESGQSPRQGQRQLRGPMPGCHSHCPAGTGSWQTPEPPEPLTFRALCWRGIQLAATVLVY